jgi:hypothetical protein
LRFSVFIVFARNSRTETNGSQTPETGARNFPVRVRALFLSEIRDGDNDACWKSPILQWGGRPE